jgi:hypothetical protein
MAGAGVKLFTAGSQLTATEVNTYLMDQVVAYFADSAARDAAFGGAGEPSLSAGRIAYLFSDNKLYVYDNTNNWVEVGAQVEDGEITTAKIAALAVTAAKIASDAVTTAKILDANVTAAKLASDAVTTAKILDANVTAAKIASDAVTTVKILDANVTTAKIADSAITSAKIADGTIVNADVSTTAAIDLGKLADATIDEKVASYTLVLTDKNKFIKMSVTSTANTVTVPANASVAFPIGSQIHIIQYGSGKTQVIPVNGTVTIYSSPTSAPGAYLRDQYTSATLLKCDTNTWMLMGDLSAT